MSGDEAFANKSDEAFILTIPWRNLTIADFVFHQFLQSSEWLWILIFHQQSDLFVTYKFIIKRMWAEEEEKFNILTTISPLQWGQQKYMKCQMMTKHCFSLLSSLLIVAMTVKRFVARKEIFIAKNLLAKASWMKKIITSQNSEQTLSYHPLPP